MKFSISLITWFCLSLHLLQTNWSWAEPVIVLEFSNNNQFSMGDGINAFSMDPNHSENYTVESGDSLNSILKKFYKGSGLDWRYVQLSIVIANPKAFANNNPNFLFSGMKLFLPGKADISNLLIGKKVGNKKQEYDGDSRAQSIYFFGG